MADEQEATVRTGRQAPYKRLPDAVMDDDTISPEAKLTYWYLMRIAGYTTSQAKVSLGRIAEKLGRARTNRKSARGWVRELSAAGWIDVHERHSPTTGARLASEYVVHEVPPENHGSSPVPPPRISDEPAPGANLIPPPGYPDDPPSSRSSFDVDSEPKGSDSDACAPCPGPQCSTSEGGQEQTGGEDHGPDLFASWQGFNPEHPESQDQGQTRPDVVAQNGNGTHGGSGVKVTRTKRSSSRAPLPPEQSANVGRSTGRWVDAYRDAHAGVEPSAQRRAQAGREIRALIVAGNDPERVLHAAESAGRAGFATVEQQLVRMTSTNGGSRPGRVSATELPRDDWRRFVQE